MLTYLYEIVNMYVNRTQVGIVSKTSEIKEPPFLLKIPTRYKCL